MSILNSGKVGNISYNRQLEERKLIKEAWSAMGLLEGLSGHVEDNVAQLYENQAQHMLKESTDTAGSNGSYETIVFPLVRRVYSRLLANDIVSVQALSMPIGKIFYFVPKISKTPHTAYDGAYENAATQANKTQFENRSLYDMYYGNTDMYGENQGLFDRTKGNPTVQTATFDYANGIVTVAGISPDTQGKLVNAEGHVIDTESFLSSLKVVAANDIYNGTDVVIPAGSVIPFSLVPQTWGQGIADKSNGGVKVKLDLSVATDTGYVLANASDDQGEPLVAADFTVTYKTYAKLEENSEMAEISFDITDVTISVVSRKLRAKWTPELSTDVMAFQNIDAEAELTNMLSETIAAEIDREILRDLRTGAAWTARWDYNGLRKQANTYYGVQKDYNQTLITKINQVLAQIEKSTLVSGTAWLVVSSEVSALLNDLEYFHVSNASPEQNKYNLGIERIGTLQGRYTVYKDNYAPADTILVGIKGNSILSTGYVYAPYVPVALTPVLTDTRDFTNVRGITTRYAKKMINNRFYGRVLVDGLHTWDMGLAAL